MRVGDGGVSVGDGGVSSRLIVGGKQRKVTEVMPQTVLLGLQLQHQCI